MPGSVSTTRSASSPRRRAQRAAIVRVIAAAVKALVETIRFGSARTC